MATDWKDLGRRFYDEVMVQGELDVIDELVAETYVEHQEIPGVTPDRAGLKQFVEMNRAAFPDLQVEVLGMAVDGDQLWMHVAMTGTHQGEFNGIAPTGKSVRAEMIDRVRIVDDKAVEHWGVSDDLGMLTQLGVIPEMG
jgi:predicted ester cyclase